MANEKRLIDANALKAHVNSLSTHWLCEWDTLGVLNAIDNQITVDAVEVVHGCWIDSYSVDHMGRIVEHGIDCSVCESVFKDDSREVVKHWKEQFKSCPFCGAKMDGGNEDA